MQKDDAGSKPQIAPPPSESFVEVVLAAHNQLRRRVKQPPLTWSEELYQIAAHNATSLAATEIRSIPALKYVRTEGQRTLIAFEVLKDMTASQAAADCIRQCETEKGSYTLGAPMTSAPTKAGSGYAQMVWPATTHVGAAWAQSGRGCALVFVYTPVADAYSEPPAAPAQPSPAPAQPSPAPAQPSPAPAQPSGAPAGLVVPKLTEEALERAEAGASPPQRPDSGPQRADSGPRRAESSPPRRDSSATSHRRDSNATSAHPHLREALLKGHDVIRKIAKLPAMEWSNKLEHHARRLLTHFSDTSQPDNTAVASLGLEGKVVHWKSPVPLPPQEAAERCCQVVRESLETSRDYACVNQEVNTSVGAAMDTNDNGTFLVVVYGDDCVKKAEFKFPAVGAPGGAISSPVVMDLPDLPRRRPSVSFAAEPIVQNAASPEAEPTRPAQPADSLGVPKPPTEAPGGRCEGLGGNGSSTVAQRPGRTGFWAGTSQTFRDVMQASHDIIRRDAQRPPLQWSTDMEDCAKRLAASYADTRRLDQWLIGALGLQGHLLHWKSPLQLEPHNAARECSRVFMKEAQGPGLHGDVDLNYACIVRETTTSFGAACAQGDMGTFVIAVYATPKPFPTMKRLDSLGRVTSDPTDPSPRQVSDPLRQASRGGTFKEGMVLGHDLIRRDAQRPPLQWSTDMEDCAKRLAASYADTRRLDPWLIGAIGLQGHLLHWKSPLQLEPHTAARDCCRAFTKEVQGPGLHGDVELDYACLIRETTTSFGAACVQGDMGTFAIAVYATPKPFPTMRRLDSLGRFTSDPTDPSPRQVPDASRPAFKGNTFKEVMLAGHKAIRQDAGLPLLEWSIDMEESAKHLVNYFADLNRMDTWLVESLGLQNRLLQWKSPLAVDPCAAAQQCCRQFLAEIQAPGLRGDADLEYSCLVREATSSFAAAALQGSRGTFVIAIYALPREAALQSFLAAAAGRQAKDQPLRGRNSLYVADGLDGSFRASKAVIIVGADQKESTASQAAGLQRKASFKGGSFKEVMVAGHKALRTDVGLQPLQWSGEMEEFAKSIVASFAEFNRIDGWVVDSMGLHGNVLQWKSPLALEAPLAAHQCCRQFGKEAQTPGLQGDADVEFACLVRPSVTHFGAAFAKSERGSFVVAVYIVPQEIPAKLTKGPSSRQLRKSSQDMGTAFGGTQASALSGPSASQRRMSVKPGSTAPPFRDVILAGHGDIRAEAEVPPLQWSAEMEESAKQLVKFYTDHNRPDVYTITAVSLKGNVVHWKSLFDLDPHAAARQCCAALRREAQSPANVGEEETDYACIIKPATTHVGAAIQSGERGTFIVLVYAAPQAPLRRKMTGHSLLDGARRGSSNALLAAGDATSPPSGGSTKGSKAGALDPRTATLRAENRSPFMERQATTSPGKILPPTGDGSTPSKNLAAARRSSPLPMGKPPSPGHQSNSPPSGSSFHRLPDDPRPSASPFGPLYPPTTMNTPPPRGALSPTDLLGTTSPTSPQSGSFDEAEHRGERGIISPTHHTVPGREARGNRSPFVSPHKGPQPKEAPLAQARGAAHEASGGPHRSRASSGADPEVSTLAKPRPATDATLRTAQQRRGSGQKPSAEPPAPDLGPAARLASKPKLLATPTDSTRLRQGTEAPLGSVSPRIEEKVESFSRGRATNSPAPNAASLSARGSSTPSRDPGGYRATSPMPKGVTSPHLTVRSSTPSGVRSPTPTLGLDGTSPSTGTGIRTATSFRLSPGGSLAGSSESTSARSEKGGSDAVSMGPAHKYSAASAKQRPPGIPPFAQPSPRPPTVPTQASGPR